MRHPVSEIKIPVSMHKGRDIPVGTLASILKQVGVSLEDWLEL
jgi:predicted RNA binding protein YcfA (HicA-like mRNA interferase family)